MAYCGKCGNELKDGAKFCPICGTPIVNKHAKSESSDNSSNYSIELISVGLETFQVTKVLIDLLGVETREAKNIISSLPYILATGLSLSRAEEIALLLQNAGAEIAIKQNDKPVQNKTTIQNNPLFQIKEQTENKQTTDRTLVEHKYSEDGNHYTDGVYQGISSIDGRNGIFKTICGVAVVLAVLWYLGVFEGEILSIPQGRAAFVIKNQDCSNTSVSNINKIIMYEGNSRQDCKVEGENKNGEIFTYNGKWEEEEYGFLSFRKYYILKFNDFNLLIKGNKDVCFHKGDNSGIKYALKHSSIGKLSPISQEEETIISEKFTKKIEEQKQRDEAKRMEELKEYLGTYYYNYCPPGMPLNVSMYFKITLNPDGTFSHEGSNDETKTYMMQSSLIDGKYFPSGGKWSVINTSGIKGVFLYFEGSWGKGSINLDNDVLEIPNMNGYKLKVRTSK